MSATSKRVLASYSGTTVSYETDRVVDLALTLAHELEAAEAALELRALHTLVSHRPSAAAQRARHGWPPLSEEQQARNLAHNLGATAPVFLAAELKRSEALEARIAALESQLATARRDALREAAEWCREMADDAASCAQTFPSVRHSLDVASRAKAYAFAEARLRALADKPKDETLEGKG